MKRNSLHCLLLLLLAAAGSSAQGFRFDSQVQQQGTVAGITNVVVVPANPTISFCNFPANAVPCTNKATTYTSVTLGTPCSTSTQIVLTNTTSCVANPDLQGNWGVWVPAGQYSYTISAGGGNFGPYVVNFGIPAGSAISPGTVNGPTTYSGNNTHSGTEAFANINKTVYVDGVTNTSIASAVAAACNGTTPGVVVISPGTWSFSSSITVPSHCTISGPRAAIVAPTSNFGAFMSSATLTDVVFDGFTLQTSGMAFSGNSDHVTIRNMKFLNTGSTAVSFNGTVGNPGTTHHDIKITNNECESPATFFCFAVGQDVQPNAGSFNVDVSLNKMKNCAGDCVITQGITGVTYTGNQVNLCGDTCLEVGVGDQVVTVSGNVVDISASVSGSIVGISSRSAQHVTVSGNTVRGNAGSSGTQNCLLAWHNGGDAQAEQYFSYTGNTTTGCAIGLKIFQSDHFTIGGNEHQNDATPVSIDTTAGGATDWAEGPSRGDPNFVFSGTGTPHIYFQGNFAGQNGYGATGSFGTPFVLQTSPTIITPILSGLTNATGLQLFNTTTTCTTGSAAGSTCTTAAITLPVAEADTSYRVVCTGKGPTNVPVVTNTTNSSATQFTITIAALTAAPASFASYDCTAGHN
jgi:hypothetical protein